MFGMSKRHDGFTLLELIIGLAIIGIMATVLVPRLKWRGTKPIDQFVAKITSLTRVGYERAILSGKVHRVYFSFREPMKVTLQVSSGEHSTLGEAQFVSATTAYAPISYTWDSEKFSFLNFYIKGIDEAKRDGLKDAWFFILPEGISQEIIINIRDEQTAAVRGLVLNPFTVKFSIYDSLRKP